MFIPYLLDLGTYWYVNFQKQANGLQGVLMNFLNVINWIRMCFQWKEKSRTESMCVIKLSAWQNDFPQISLVYEQITYQSVYWPINR